MRVAILAAALALTACGDGRRLGGKYAEKPAAAAGSPSVSAGTSGQAGSSFVPSAGSGHSGGSSSSAGSGGSAGTPEPPQCDGVTSFGAESFDVEGHPFSVEIADVDGDGASDLVAATYEGIGVLQADGGRLKPIAISVWDGPPYVAVGPRWVTSGDLNADGKLDLLTSDMASNVNVSLGRGDGTFLERQNYALPDYPRPVIAADVNGDQLLDLAVAGSKDETSPWFGVLLGNGDGTLQPATIHEVDEAGLWLSAGGFGLADLNGDEHPDVVLATHSRSPLVFSEQVTVFLGNGDGTFQDAPPLLSFDANLAELELADFDDDGRIDLAIASEDRSYDPQGAIQLLLGNGDGTFQAARSFPTGSAGDGLRCLRAADMNDDGKLDVVASDYQDPGYFANVNVLLGNGDGTLQNAERFSIGSNPNSLGIGDLNGDGKLDVAASNLHTESVSVLLGSGDGSLQGGQHLRIDNRYANHGYSATLGVADFDGDAALDLIADSWYLDSATLLLSSGDRSFDTQLVDVAADKSLATALGDVNRDGNIDIATGYSNVPVRIALGNGDGTFQAAQSVGFADGIVNALLDLNGDQRLDMVAACSVLLGNGDGTFAATDPLPMAECTLLSAGELDGDGKPDLVVGSYDSGIVTIFLGNGDGTFQAPLELAATGTPVEISDLNGDDRGDLVVSNYDTETVDVFLGNGDGTFQDPQSFDVGGVPWYIAIGDLDGDRELDLAVTISRPDRVSVLFGNGDGTFRARRDFATGLWTEHIAIADMNGDKQPDIVVQTEYDVIDVLYGHRECR